MNRIVPSKLAPSTSAFTRRRLSAIASSVGFTCALGLVACTAPSQQEAEPSEEIGAARQALVNGNVLSASDAARLGAVTVFHGPTGTFCSGTLLRADWVLTANHCAAGADASQWTVTYGSQSRTGRSGEWPVGFTFPDARVDWVDGALIHLSSPFDIQNAKNPDAPFHRNLFAGSTGSIVGLRAFCFGSGYGSTATAGDLCSPLSGTLGTARSASFTLRPPSASTITAPEYVFEVRPENGAQPLPGDSGSTCLLGDLDSGAITGTLSQASCGSWSLYHSAELYRDAVVDTIGAQRSPKAIYAIDGSGGLTEYWHKGQPSRNFDWISGRVGSSWNLPKVVSDGSVLYAIDAGGNMTWYRHDGHFDQSFVWGDRSGRQVRTGLAGKHVAAAGQGTIYTVDSVGRVRLYEHRAHNVGAFAQTRTSEAEWAMADGVAVGQAFSLAQLGLPGGQVTHIVAPTPRELVVRRSDGSLTLLSRNSSNQLQNLGVIGTFPNVVDMIARAEGTRLYFYTTSADGLLSEVEYLGGGRWSPAVVVGSGWNTVRLVGSGRLQF